MQTSDSGQEYISISIDNTQAKNKAKERAYDKLTQIAKELNDLTKGKFAIEQLLQTATVNPDTHETLCVVNPRAPFAELAMMMG